MRTFKEMAAEALAKRNELLGEGTDPTTAAFQVTQQEQFKLKCEPPFEHPLMPSDRSRLCGLRIEVVEATPPNSKEQI